MVNGDGRPVCSVCQKELWPQAVGVWVKVSGWAQNRSEGGTHALRNREIVEPGEWVHDLCMNDARNTGQEAML